MTAQTPGKTDTGKTDTGETTPEPKPMKPNNDYPPLLNPDIKKKPAAQVVDDVAPDEEPDPAQA
jgi:hypothetical protein